MENMVMWFLITVLTFLQMKKLQQPFLCTMKPFNLKDITFKETTIVFGKLLYRIWKCLSWGFISFQNVTFPHSTAWARSREGEKPAVSLSYPSSDTELQRVHHIQHPCCPLAGNVLISSTLCLVSVISSDVFGTALGTQDAFCFLKTRQSEVDLLFSNTWALTPLSLPWWAMLILV